MGRLSSEQILREKKTVDSSSILSLSLTHKALSDVSCLGVFKNLEKLDLRFNNLTSLEGLRECLNLKWLSVVQNKLQCLKGIEGLTKLTVLNAGKNKIRSMDEVQCLVNLRALIMNDNEIESVCRLDRLKELNTIVLSRNPIRKISLDKVKSITKISLSNCQLESIDSSIKVCTELKELRLAHNGIKTIPAELAQNTKLQNLDLGNNVITSWSDLKVLSSLQNLKNLNLQGNLVAGKDKVMKKVKKLIPGLQIFNAKPIEKYIKNENYETVEDPSVVTTDDHDASKKKKKRRESGVEEKSSTRKEQKEDSGLEKKKSKRALKEVDRGSSLDLTVGKKYEEKREHTNKKKHVKELVTNENTNGDQDNTKCDEKKGKKEKKKKKAKEHAAKEASTQEAKGVTSGWQLKRKAEKIIEDEDTPFTELMAIDNTSDLEHKGEEKTSGKAVQNRDFLSALVIVPAKKKKAKKLHAGSAELQLLAQANEVGLGGPSAWGNE